jgi:hypothetical protein
VAADDQAGAVGEEHFFVYVQLVGALGDFVDRTPGRGELADGAGRVGAGGEHDAAGDATSCGFLECADDRPVLEFLRMLACYEDSVLAAGVASSIYDGSQRGAPRVVVDVGTQ